MAIGEMLKRALAGMRDEQRYGKQDHASMAPSDDPYAKAVQDYQAANRKSRVPQIMEMLGATIAPSQNPTDVAQRYDEKATAGLEGAIERLNEARKREREDEDYDYTRTTREREGTEWEQQQQEYGVEQEMKAERRDPNSELSNRTRAAITKILPSLGPELEGMSADDIERVYGGGRMGELIKSQRAEAEHERAKELQKMKDDAAAAAAAAKPSEAEKVSEREMTKDYEEFVNEGGTSEYQSDMQKLDEVAKKLEKLDKGILPSRASGNFAGRFPDWMRSEEGRTLEQDVMSVAMKNLKNILGGQFTEAEAQRFLGTIYDPTLSESENARKVRQLMKQLETGMENRIKGFQRLPESVRGDLVMPSYQGQGSPSPQEKQTKKWDEM